MHILNTCFLPVENSPLVGGLYITLTFKAICGITDMNVVRISGKKKESTITTLDIGQTDHEQIRSRINNN